MSNLKPGNVYIEISHNQAGGLSLCVGNDDGGYRISGDKVGGCETLKCFEVNADELIEKIREHIKKVTAEPEHIDEIAIQAGINPAWADAYMQGYHDAVAAMLQAGNSPATPDGWVMVPKEMTPEIMRSVQRDSSLGTFASAHLNGAFDMYREFWSVAIAAAQK
ncbi:MULTISPECIES: hypothetical protein [Citrobacter freundii complex]|uniref:hypothetical protein n=1 Tax=Citrobacter freundii complex TaxID=1344959 RepID=UPI001F5D37D1|nr:MULTISPECIES: hypothetical protein [Citrobacter]MDX7440947.1 hypothetical protein [Citrobacter cronae]